MEIASSVSQLLLLQSESLMITLLETLLRVLGELPPKDAPTMIFCNTHGACRNLQSWLSGVHEIHDLTGGADHIACIHSRVPREERQKLLKDYLNGKISTLICTDIASRGLDTTNVSV